MCLVAKCFSRATLLWLIEEGKYRRQNQRQRLTYNQVTLSLTPIQRLGN